MSDDDAAYTFGDIEPDDVFDPTAPPAPEQVAYRLHELRAYLESVHALDALPSWVELEPAAQQLGIRVGEVIVAWLIETDPDHPERAARHLHDVRRYWGGALPPWDELPDDQRQVGIDLLAAIIDWLRAEGSLR